jgi:hypothetical protein
MNPSVRPLTASANRNPDAAETDHPAERLSFVDFFHVLIKDKWLLLACILASVLCDTVYMTFAEPIHEHQQRFLLTYQALRFSRLGLLSMVGSGVREELPTCPAGEAFRALHEHFTKPAAFLEADEKVPRVSLPMQPIATDRISCSMCKLKLMNQVQLVAAHGDR